MTAKIAESDWRLSNQANSDNSAASGRVYFLPGHSSEHLPRQQCGLPFDRRDLRRCAGYLSHRPDRQLTCGLSGRTDTTCAKGPSFFRFDLSLAKKVKFTERLNLEMRAEALNAFNNINWLVGAAGNDVNRPSASTPASSAGTSAYRDISTRTTWRPSHPAGSEA
jgi:hypothetical protein